MAKLVESVIDSLLKGLYKAPNQGAYTPTLVVGLGGTGLKVVRTLKKCLAHHSEQRVRLLGIDSDETENRKYPELPSLDDKELCVLNQGVATSALARANEGQPEYRHILDFLPDSYESYTGLHQAVLQKIQTRKGAGQFRRAGKLLFDTNVNAGGNLNRRFRDAKDELAGLSTMLEKQIAGIQIDTGKKIYVVTSATGGTGAGTLLDCLALLRTHFNGTSDMISVFVVLPGSTLDDELTAQMEEKANTRGNTLGLLRELQSLGLGEFGHTFVFDKNLSFECKGMPLFNDCFLVDNSLYDGTPVTSYMEICEAIGYFLYGLVGTGVGAARDSGLINGQIVEAKQWEAIPGIFSTIGIGVLEYPIDSLGRFGIQYALDHLMGHWLSDKYDTKSVVAEVAQTLNSMGCGDLDSLRSALNFSPEEAKFFSGSAAERVVRSEPDDKFIGAGRNKRAQIDAQLAEYDEVLRQRTDTIIKNCVKILDERSREMVAGNQALAKAYSQKLVAALMGVRDMLLEDHKVRKAKSEELKKTIADLEVKIDFWDFYLDRKPRRRYIQEMNSYLGLKRDDKAHNYLSDILATAIQKANETNSSILNISLGFENISKLNRDRMDAAIRDESRLGFIQSAMPCEKFAAWVKQIQLPVRLKFTASQLNEETVLIEALQDAGPELLRRLQSLDIIQDSRRDAGIRRRVESLNTASQPFIYRTRTAPDESELKPSKFIAGNVVGADDPFLRNFSRIANGPVVGIPTANPHMVICSRTLHGFGIAHWAEYKAALRCYRAKEWYFHTFGDLDEMSPIERTTGEENDKLELFGLGMMFDFIIKRGSNYYRNMVRSEDKKTYHYLTYHKELCSYSERLCAEGRIQIAIKSEVRPRPENLIGKSIIEAKDAMGSVEWQPFVRDIEDLAMDFVSIVGKPEARAAITSYIEDVLVNEMLSTEKNSERRELLKKISEILKKYAERIR